MVPALSLWLPILLSTVVVFILSSLVHMLLKYHCKDYGKFPSEDELMADLRKYELEPGEYYMPYIKDMKERETPEYKEKLANGPVGFVTITSSDLEMGKSLAQWFVYCLLVGFIYALGTAAVFGWLWP